MMIKEDSLTGELEVVESVEEVYDKLPLSGTIYDGVLEIPIHAKSFVSHRDKWSCPGIYCIYNVLSNKIYIGMSNNVTERIKQHKRELTPSNKTRHSNQAMFNDSMKHGVHYFVFGVIETFDDDVEREFLLRREEEWIQFYENKSSNCIYNVHRLTNLREFYPIDYLIADVLIMKNKAWDIQAIDLFYYCDSLEKKLFKIKYGEMELSLGDINLSSNQSLGSLIR